MNEATYVTYSEQDTADKLILPYLTKYYAYPSPSSLDYQAQRTTKLPDGSSGRYDGLYLYKGFPYVLLEAKKYAHDLTAQDIAQARSYCTSPLFQVPVPFFVVSNGRHHRFFRRTETINPADGLLHYLEISPVSWKTTILENPGEIKQLLHERDLIHSLLSFKEQVSRDLVAMFRDPSDGLLKPERHPLGTYLDKIIEERHLFIGDGNRRTQRSVRHAIEAVSLHFTTKILFIKLIEDLSSDSATPRVVHDLFPRREYDLIGGLFGFKVLNGLSKQDERTALQLISNARKFYLKMAQDIARVTWQDIFRYGFRFHSGRYGKLFKSANYDRFLPSEETLSSIHSRLIGIDIRYAVLYGPPEARSSVIGRIYEKLIDEELRNSTGAVYTPDTVLNFMIQLSKGPAGTLRGKKILEPSCGSGHFYRRLYRLYVDEITAALVSEGLPEDYLAAHQEAMSHIYGRDIDPFAVQLTLLGTFLEQLKDGVLLVSQVQDKRVKQWTANKSIDTQNSLDPITIDPERYFDVQSTRDLSTALSLAKSCERALLPDIVIGNPPYGVKVVKGDHYDDVYSLGSPDSYGYFIANALSRVREGGVVVFIVSSSFLTIKTHEELRLLILSKAKIRRVVKLSRHTFPGIDIFPVVLELEKCSSEEERGQNLYAFYDLWQLHPETDAAELDRTLAAILEPVESTEWPRERTRTAKYIVRQGVIGTFSRSPIFEGVASLYPYMRDVYLGAPPAERNYEGRDGEVHRFRPSVYRGREFVKLSAIAEVKVGLQSGDNAKFFRTAPGVYGGAVRGGYRTVNSLNVVPSADLLSLTEEERSYGIEVDDPLNDQYYVPLDKAATTEIETQLLPQFYRPIDFYVNWSRSAVEEMRAHEGAVFRNPHLYFMRGVSFSNTGIYSPTFRLSHGGVFDQTGSCIFSQVLSPEFLLGLLASRPLKYLIKSFINHAVHAQLDDLPIILATRAEVSEIEEQTIEIVERLRLDPSFDYRRLHQRLDASVAKLYGMKSSEVEEIRTWYIRHYPSLFENTAPLPDLP